MPLPTPQPSRIAAAFTLLELLVSLAILALLIALVLPALGTARRTSVTARCLINIRNMQVAHWMYMSDWNGRFIDVGLSHGGGDENEDVAWVNTLSEYYGSRLLHRSPADTSPHWAPEDGGMGVPISAGPPPQYRRTSYGVNNFLTTLAPIRTYRRLEDVPRPSSTVQFLIMSYTGAFAGADHTHVENWYVTGLPNSPPILATAQVQTNAHGGPKRSWDSISNWGFLDGHAETLRFREVFTDFTVNKFDPAVAR